ncbi:MAG: glycoside hydrolase family 18 protein [Bacteroidaceae bacterium]|nr:glycoside hydrolase family 18 protein [Bacteroidaceae bacterium]
MLKRLSTLVVLLCFFLAAFPAGKNERVVVGYVTSWNTFMPDPRYVTHLNYAFGHVDESFKSVRIDNPARLKQIVGLKAQNPNLKVMLSIGGWGSGRFSEMAANEHYRLMFCESCRRIVKEYGLDGIDIDWEYPTSSDAGISSSPDDTRNFTLLMRDLRKVLTRLKCVTMATAAGAAYIDFKAVMPYVDFVNVMAYDMASFPQHHAALYGPEDASWMTSAKAVEKHLEAGVPKEKLVMGMPFYGKGQFRLPEHVDMEQVRQERGLSEMWDSIGHYPYLADKNGQRVYTYENIQSLSDKCSFILEKGIRGGMYWDCSGDTDNHDLGRTVWEMLR